MQILLHPRNIFPRPAWYSNVHVNTFVSQVCVTSPKEAALDTEVLCTAGWDWCWHRLSRESGSLSSQKLHLHRRERGKTPILGRCGLPCKHSHVLRVLRALGDTPATNKGCFYGFPWVRPVQTPGNASTSNKTLQRADGLNNTWNLSLNRRRFFPLWNWKETLE